MHVAIVHGYFLGDSGSGVYTRQLAEALTRLGHDVTLVCQERDPERYAFIDSVWALDPANTTLTQLAERPPADRVGPGSCRLVRPDDGGRLLVYVDGPFAGFERDGVRAFQDAPAEWIDAFVARNVAALRTTVERWPSDVVLAQHTIAQPQIVREALAGRCPYTVTVHGSELNFSLRSDARLAPLGISGLSGASAVVALTQSSLADVVGWAAQYGLAIAEKGAVLPPGIDFSVFAPAPSRGAAVDALVREVGLPADFEFAPDDDVLAFAARVGWNKGIHHLVVAVSLLAAERPGVCLLVAGDGPARASLERLAALLSAGEAEAAREFAASDPELRTTEEFGPLIPDGAGPFGEARIAFLGHLPAAGVARIFATADVAVAPSIFPEAAGLVTSEALAAGALPLAAYHSGLAAIADIVADEFGDPMFTQLRAGAGLTAGIVDAVRWLLDRYPTADPAFRARLHALAEKRFPTWDEIARRYLALAMGAGHGAPHARRADRPDASGPGACAPRR